MTDLKQMSLIEAAEKILRTNGQPMSFYELFKDLCEVKEMTDEDRTKLISQFYADFIISAKFIYMGDDLWDLKSRQSIDLWDKDGAYYQEFPEYDEADEVVEDLDDEDEADLDDDLDEDLEEEEEDSVVEKDFEATLDDEDFDDEDDDVVPDEEEVFDDDKYNEYMDDYEDMYDE
jgi:DNA-directed RNA polymerase subunit delta